jgi:preprotein translocase subunit YajC
MISEFSLILADTAPAATDASPFSNPLIPFVLIGVIFYFLVLRPQQKKQKELDSLLTSLKTGDKVVTNSGIHGIISNVKEGKTLILKIADNVKIEIDKSSIAYLEKSSDTSTVAVPAA